MRAYKRLIVITSALMLLPLLAGALLWNRLPDPVPTHFNWNWEPDGYSSKAFAVLGLPLLLLGIHLVCIAVTFLDPKNRGSNVKIKMLILWICPATALFAFGMIDSAALGVQMNFTRISLCWTGILFLVLGNYLPKCRQNYTIGIKLPWTLANEENWNRTHRMTGRLWMTGGAALLVCALFGVASPWLLAAILLVLTLAPVVYSLALYLRRPQA